MCSYAAYPIYIEIMALYLEDLDIERVSPCFHFPEFDIAGSQNLEALLGVEDYVAQGQPLQ